MSFPGNIEYVSLLIWSQLITENYLTAILIQLKYIDLQVVCGECILTTHRNHLNEPIARIAKSQLTNLRQAVVRAKTVVEESAVASSKLLAASKNIEAHCNKVHNEVEKFIEDYIKAVEDHKMNLLEQIKQVRKINR